MNPNQFLSQIKKDRDNTEEAYKIKSALFLQHYNLEQELAAEYHGRQILELMQNADDAGAKTLWIKLDTVNQLLTVANNGIAFSPEGVESIRLGGVSTKPKTKFIGNKGLGFRSVLKWSTSLTLYTHGCKIQFSEELAKQKFETLVPPEEQENIRKNAGLADTLAPFPILSLPMMDIDEEGEGDRTLLEVNYVYGMQDSIETQLTSISPELLLFLKNLETIFIKVDTEPERKVHLTKTTRDTLDDESKTEQYLAQDENIIWNVVYMENPLPSNLQDKRKKDLEKYSIGIAWQDSLNDCVFKLFSFFPTKEQLPLPCIVHATCDLSSNRNGLNESRKNEFILGEVVKVLQKVAEKVKLEAVDWRPYRILSPVVGNSNPTFNKFFQNLSKIRSTSEIYPAADGKYYHLEAVNFYGNDFADWVIRNNVQSDFRGLLLSLPEGTELPPSSTNNKYGVEEFMSFIDVVSPKIVIVEERVRLIRLLLGDPFKKYHQRHFPLLLTEGSNLPASANTEVFTLKQGSIDEYKIPSYAAIGFIDTSFYRHLENEFTSEITISRIGNEHPSRPLKRVLSSIVNLGSNDIINVIQNLTRCFNAVGDKVSTDYCEYVLCLFRIFKKNPERRGSLSEPIFLLNRNGMVRKADELFLGKEFKSGIITEKIYNGYYTDADYLAGDDVWQLPLDGHDRNILDDFFVWLGVNKYVKFKKIKQKLDGKYNDDEYSAFVFSNIGVPELISSREYEVVAFDGLDKLVKSQYFRMEKLIALILRQRSLYKKLDDEANDDDFSHYYNGNTRKPSSKPSYFKYQLSKSRVFEDVFVDIEFAQALGLKAINTKDSLFLELGIDETEVLDVMHKVGVKTSICDLSVDRVYKLLDVQLEDHAAARKLYQLTFDYFRKLGSEKLCNFERQSRLLAVKNKTKEYRSTEEVYYSDNVTLPSKIIEQFWIFDFPKRSGEKQVAEFFGVKTFKDLDIKVNSGYQLHQESIPFSAWFSKIKPYLLTYRLNTLKKESGEKLVVGLMKAVQIHLVSTLDYLINAGGQNALLPNEFINTGRQEFFLCAEANASLETLKETPAFCEAFAEILCVLFEVNENKDEFRSIFKDKPALKDTAYLIETRSLQRKLEEATKLLGVSRAKLEFWKAVASLLDVSCNDEILTSEELNLKLISKLPFQIGDDLRVNYETFDNEPAVLLLGELVMQGVNLKKLNEVYPAFSALQHWHAAKLNQVALDVEEVWGKAWWKHLFNLPKEQNSAQKTFNSSRKKFPNKIHSVIEEVSKLHRFDLELNYKELLLSGLEKDVPFSLIDEELNDIKLENLYTELLDRNKVVLSDLSDEQQSLLFFPGNTALIEKDIHQVEGRDSDADVNIEESGDDSTLFEIIPTSLGKASVSGSHLEGVKKPGKGGTYNDSVDKRKKWAGKKAEKLVRDRLKQKYPNGEVFWISGNSDENRIPLDDSKGYDIRYKKNKHDLEWLYVEVKHFSGASFIISLNEINTGIENSTQYELALVTENVIFWVEGFFRDSERVEEFRSLCSSSSIKPLDFEVFVRLDEKVTPSTPNNVESLSYEVV